MWPAMSLLHSLCLKLQNLLNSIVFHVVCDLTAVQSKPQITEFTQLPLYSKCFLGNVFTGV